jgi:hypothetical protein
MSLEATRLKSSRPQSSRFEVPDRFNLDQPVAKQDLTSPERSLASGALQARFVA